MMKKNIPCSTQNSIESLRSKMNKTSSPTLAGALTMSISAALVAPLAFAEEVQLDELTVEDQGIAADANPYAEPGAPYKVKKLSDARQTRDIADTPKTVTVLTMDAIEASGKTALKDLLSAQPGITLGTGEGGNSFGDRYIIRGYEARSDIYTDGLREPGLITRETFALEQVEISKGPSSTFAGRGSTGGAVNTVTKKATVDGTFHSAELGLGTDSFGRLSFDSNNVVSSDTAVRFNLLYTSKDTPDRAPAGAERVGILASAVHNVSDELQLSADFYHFEADDRSDPGHAYVRDTGEFNAYDYVGQDGLDFHKSSADIVTFSVDYQVSPDTVLENKTRFGDTDNGFVVSGISRDALRSYNGWQDNSYVGNQTNLIVGKEMGGKQHTFVAGIEFAKETVAAGGYSIDGALTGTLDPYNAQNNLWSGTVTKNPRATELDLQTVSVYLMDTVALSAKMELFAGLRYDNFDFALEKSPSTDRDGNPVAGDNFTYGDGLVNGHLGLVYKAWDNGNVYGSVSTSSNINGGEADSGTNCGYGGLCVDAAGDYKAAEPEQSLNIELGTKWNVNDEKMLLTAALFQTTKDKVIEGGNDSYTGAGFLNTGKNRVEGIEFGLSGNITPKLSAQFGVALMQSETLKSFNDGTRPSTNRQGEVQTDDLGNVILAETSVGKPKANFADTSANFQLSYQMSPALAFGGTVTYSSEIYGGQPDAGAGTVELPSYGLLDLFASYQVNDNFSARLNVENVTDETYYTAVYRSGGIAYLGDGASAKVTLKYDF